ncbi:minor capsid protein [Enterococcus faecium]|uniref:minor capsid protein n=1 Tax=Enterococcus faecium TaxID=1352 RepID=UPI000F4EAC7A|nr:minor capsid protein [Enterococcus faecium]ROY16670.1 minor capsid protein [Enterococcus faecium]HAR1751242.1 minor capsid protein [Enterococcus faecium]
MGASIKIELEGVRKKLGDQNIRNGRYEMANRAQRDMNENFVPMRSQYLRDASFVESDGSQISWVSVYAMAQYHGGFTNRFGTVVVFSNYTTPGTGPYWDREAKPLFISSWIKAFTKGAGW